MAGEGDRSPTAGRFTTRHIFSKHASVDLKGSTGALVTFYVAHAYIQVLGFGWTVDTALGGSVTVGGVVQLYKQLKSNGGSAAQINAVASLTFDSANVIRSPQFQSLYLNTAVSPIAGPPAYPTAERGDALILQLTTQGTGAATQSVTPYIYYRERTQASGG